MFNFVEISSRCLKIPSRGGFVQPVLSASTAFTLSSACYWRPMSVGQLQLNRFKFPSHKWISTSQFSDAGRSLLNEEERAEGTRVWFPSLHTREVRCLFPMFLFLETCAATLRWKWSSPSSDILLFCRSRLHEYCQKGLVAFENPNAHSNALSFESITLAGKLLRLTIKYMTGTL